MINDPFFYALGGWVARKKRRSKKPWRTLVAGDMCLPQNPRQDLKFGHVGHVLIMLQMGWHIQGRNRRSR